MDILKRLLVGFECISCSVVDCLINSLHTSGVVRAIDTILSEQCMIFNNYNRGSG